MTSNASTSTPAASREREWTSWKSDYAPSSVELRDAPLQVRDELSQFGQLRKSAETFSQSRLEMAGYPEMDPGRPNSDAGLRRRHGPFPDRDVTGDADLPRQR